MYIRAHGYVTMLRYVQTNRKRTQERKISLMFVAYCLNLFCLFFDLFHICSRFRLVWRSLYSLNLLFSLGVNKPLEWNKYRTLFTTLESMGCGWFMSLISKIFVSQFYRSKFYVSIDNCCVCVYVCMQGLTLPSLKSGCCRPKCVCVCVCMRAGTYTAMVDVCVLQAKVCVCARVCVCVCVGTYTDMVDVCVLQAEVVFLYEI